MIKLKVFLIIVLLIFLGFGSAKLHGQVCSVDTLTANFLSCQDQGTLDPRDDQYIADFSTTFTNQPMTGDIELLVKGQTYSTSVTGLSMMFQFLSIPLPADGMPVVATLRFTADTACTLTQTVGTAPAACSPPIPEPTPVPTLSQWVTYLLVFVLMAVGVAAFRWRRGSHTR